MYRHYLDIQKCLYIYAQITCLRFRWVWRIGPLSCSWIRTEASSIALLDLPCHRAVRHSLPHISVPGGSSVPSLERRQGLSVPSQPQFLSIEKISFVTFWNPRRKTMPKNHKLRKSKADRHLSGVLKSFLAKRFWIASSHIKVSTGLGNKSSKNTYF